MEYALNTRSVMLMESKDGARYSFRTLRLVSMIQITNVFKVIPKILCNTLITPAVVEAAEVTTRLGSVDCRKCDVECGSYLIQQVAEEFLPLLVPIALNGTSSGYNSGSIITIVI